MAIEWLKNADEGLSRGKDSGRAVLMDFNAAPM